MQTIFLLFSSLDLDVDTQVRHVSNSRLHTMRTGDGAVSGDGALARTEQAFRTILRQC